ncbi:MAG TPA: glycosyltransferase, partial [Candidatus Acidoferrales bacterium]|nr:glycosyltransferase [Candidatus Acidoferrales bacterium]
MPAIAPGETERFGARTPQLYRHERKTATSRLTTGKPHVLLVGPLPPPPLLGGVETGVALLLGSQLAATTSMRLFNVARAEDPARRFHQRLAYQVGTCLRFARAIVQARPRIVHVKTSSGLNFYQNVLYVAIARLLGRRVLLQLHSGGFPNFFDNASGPARALIRAALRLPDGLIVLSEGWARYFQTLAAGRPITVVPNALPTAEYADATPNREAFGIPEHRVALLFVGTRHRALDVAKGFRELVRAAAQVRSRHPELLVVVAGAAADLTELEAALGPPGDGWLHVGVIATEDKATLYRSVDLFALPSHYENMPNTILEALAAGLPIVATPVGAIAEMVDEGANGFLVPVGDVDALAARIERMVADRELRRRMSACAAETAARKFDLSVLEQQLREAYASLGLSTAPAPIVWYRQPRVQRRVRLVGRLIHMPPREIAHRGRRVAAKRAARLRLQVRPRLSRGTDERTSDLLPLKDDPALSLAQRARSLGFFDVRERQDRVALAHERLRPQVERTLSQAAAILTEGIDLLGCHVRPTAAGFDWLADPERGRLWPLTVLDDSDAVRRVPADVKVVWEINRHQFLVTLARAHAYGGDERYARACIDMVRGWIVANPPPLGVNWASNLEVAIRSLSWVWALHFLMGTTALTASDCRLWLASLRRHRDYLAAHLSTYTDPTNHLIGEAAALAVLSIWLPEWDGSARLRTVALSTLARELERQVAPDGIDREQTMSYQRFVLDLLLQVIALADRNAIALPTIL